MVVKSYRTEVECIRWLNRHLARYYDPSNTMPVAQHEYAALTLLGTHAIAPSPIELLPDGIVMTYGGTPLTREAPLSVPEYRRQCEHILQTFQKIGFRHNDMLPRNVLILRERVQLVDFTLSEFGSIRIAEELPDSQWARVGQDEAILNFLERMRSGELVAEPRSGLCSGLARILRCLTLWSR